MTNGLVWAIVTPPFQVPDENNHVAYAQYLAETGRLPHVGAGERHPSELGVAAGGVPALVQSRPTWSSSQSRALFRSLDRPAIHRRYTANAGSAINNPPLYYALEAVPYRATTRLNLLDRMFFMRVLSALLAGLTVALVFGFVRELMPRTPWAWTIGALAIAFQPVFGFISGGVNNDNLVYTAGAALLFLLARAFRRGLTPRVGAGIGAVVIAGAVAKGSMFGLVPGAFIGVALAAYRTPVDRRQGAIRGAALAVAIAVIPFVLWAVANQLVFHRPVSTMSGGVESFPRDASFRGELSYLWQFFLPRLPFMNAWFGTARLPYPIYPLWDVYFQGFVGRFGWFYFGFPLWVYWLALGIFGGIIGLAGAALVRARTVLRARWPELVCYLAMLAGLLALVGTAGYRYSVATSGISFEQPRYLFPLLGLYGALVALAARGAGEKYGRAVGAFLVVLAIGHSLFGVLVTIGHYYA